MPDSGQFSDKNLLFGILAWQNGVITESQLLEAIKDWTFRKSTPMGEILVYAGALTDSQRTRLERIVADQLELHGDDPAQALGSLNGAESVANSLRQVADDDIRGSLGHVPSPRGTETYVPSRALGEGSGASSRFEILRPHARGGLGQVFVAQDTELNREVALKSLQVSSSEAHDRFRMEAEVTGGLEHPGIVPVYGLGADDAGQPFYAMRFVRGQNLQQAIARFHGASLSRRDHNLAFRDLLRRFVDVCNAMQYAHSRGVLHRDLKPGNIMLGQFGETLIVDWGLARVSGQTEVNDPRGQVRPLRLSGSMGTATQHGSVVGTLQYMSPEQASGRLDELGPTTDVYAMGATLYEILTNRPPIDRIQNSDGQDDIGATLQRIEEGDIPPPRTVSENVPRGLEAICLKALALRPEDRYASVAALAADVEHWLADEPVSAAREPVWSRLKRWARQNQPAIWGISVLVLTTLAALGIGLIVVHEEQQKTQTALEREFERHATTREALDGMFQLVVNESLRKRPFLTAADRSVLYRLRALYQDMTKDKRTDPESLTLVADALQRVGDVQIRLGESGEALQAFERNRNIWRGLATEYPARRLYKHRLVEALRRLADTRVRRGETDEGETVLKEALLLQQNLVETADADRESQRRIHGELLHSLGRLYFEANRDVEAAASLEQAAEVRSDLRSEFPESLSYPHDLALTLEYQAITARARNRRDEAAAFFDEAIGIEQDLADRFPRTERFQRVLAVLLNDSALLFRDNREYDEAESRFTKALQIRREVREKVPGDQGILISLAGSHLNLGTLNRIQDAPDVALQHYDEAARLYGRVLGDDIRYMRARRGLRSTWYGRAEAHVLRKKYGVALDAYDQALEHNSVKWGGFDADKQVALLLRRAATQLRSGGDISEILMETNSVIESARSEELGLAHYYGACVYATASAQETDPAQAELRAVEAVRLLRVALASEFDYCRMRDKFWDEDPDLIDLQERADFKALKPD